MLRIIALEIILQFKTFATVTRFHPFTLSEGLPARMIISNFALSNFYIGLVISI